MISPKGGIRDDLLNLQEQSVTENQGGKDKGMSFRCQLRRIILAARKGSDSPKVGINVSNPLPAVWSETFIDNGYMDIHRVMQALREVGFDGCAIPDHIPGMLGGHRVGEAYSIAYMCAPIQLGFQVQPWVTVARAAWLVINLQRREAKVEQAVVRNLTVAYRGSRKDESNVYRRSGQYSAPIP